MLFFKIEASPNYTGDETLCIQGSDFVKKCNEFFNTDYSTEGEVLENFERDREGVLESDFLGTTYNLRYINSISLIDINNPVVVYCAETHLRTPQLFAVSGEYCSSAYDSEETEYFIGDYSRACYEGKIYSNDSGYFECPVCNRKIAWHTGYQYQYRFLKEQQICNRCIEEMLMNEGVNNIPFEEMPFLFLVESELESEGWEKHSYHFVSGDKTELKQEIQELIDSDKWLVLPFIDDMSIVGNETHVEIYKKAKV